MKKRFQQPVVRDLALTATLAFSLTTFGSTITADYEQLEYIQSTGSQWIDTGIPASSGYKFDFDLMNCDSDNDKCVIGYKNDTQYSNMVLPLHYYNGWGYALGTGQWPKKGEARNARQQVHSELLAGSQKLVVNGTTTTNTTLGAKSYSGKTLYLFANNQQGTSVTFAMKLRLYSCKIWDANDNPLREFVPVRRCSDKAVGLLDLVAYRSNPATGFYANKGSSVFAAGEATGCLYVDGNTVYLPTTATWTNVTGDGDPANSANWACTNSLGEMIASALPTNVTVVTIPNGCTNSFPVGGAFLAREVKLPATLGADNLDWSGIAAPFSGTLDLQGKKLTLPQLTGDATITDTTDLEYELLDSIKATGVQRIPTGLKIEDNVEMEMDFGQIPEGTTSNKTFFALNNVSAPYWVFRLCVVHVSGVPIFRFYGVGEQPAAPLPQCHTGDAYDYKVRVKAGNLATGNGSVELTEYVNGEKGGTGTAGKTATHGPTYLNTSKVTDRELFLFDCNEPNLPKSQKSACTFYRLWFKDGEGTVHTLVPVRQVSTGKCGILDLEAYQADPETGFHMNDGTGEDFTPGNITNYLFKAGAVGTPGELHVNVAAGTTNVNATVALRGKLKLVKEGPGAFTATKVGQSYAGGTEVAAGLLSLPANNTSATGCLGATSGTVRVDANATLELNGNIGFNAYSLVLAGGEVRNMSGESTYSKQTATLGRVTLEADSTVTPKVSISHTGLVDLNGHTLTVGLVSAQSYTLKGNANFTNGTVNITNGGFFRALDNPRDMRTANLYIKAGVALDKDIQVNDLCLYRHDNSAAGNGGFRIYGTYMTKYTGDVYDNNFHRKCEMQDGSSLDLSTLTSAWSIKPHSSFSTCDNLAFAKNATVTVLLGNRKPKDNEQIVSWPSDNPPDTTVEFVLEPGRSARLIRKTDGLYLKNGFLIRIR